MDALNRILIAHTTQRQQHLGPVDLRFRLRVQSQQEMLKTLCLLVTDRCGVFEREQRVHAGHDVKRHVFGKRRPQRSLAQFKDKRGRFDGFNFLYQAKNKRNVLVVLGKLSQARKTPGCLADSHLGPLGKWDCAGSATGQCRC